jgi:hypothetical protein
MRDIYEGLAPDPNAEYGNMPWVPFARDKATGRVRLAMPGAVRDFLTGLLDLPAGVVTGEVTPRAALQIGFGGIGTGAALAPRGVLAAGGAKSTLPMDIAGRKARANELGFRIPVFHGTNREINPGFSLNPPHRATSGMSAREGIWALESPAAAGEHADLAAMTHEAAGQSLVPLLARADRPAQIRLLPGDDDRILTGAIRDAWDAGHDAVRVLDYPSIYSGKNEVAWVFRNPNQLRSPFARFDPAQRDSSDLMAGMAVPGPTIGFNFAPPPAPGFNLKPEKPAPSLADFRRFMADERVY